LAESKSSGWRYTPHLIIFISSACIMVIELVAGRLIARHLGSSLYTWTSIIAVILAGISVGNFLGGRMADRWKSEELLGWLFMIASAMCLLTLLLNVIFGDYSPLRGLNWPLRTFISVLGIFLLPALSLGTISPVTAKMALSRSENIGATIGSVYAWGAVGSILGTLSTGFYLIAWLGSKGVVLTVALSLAVIGLCLGPRRWVHAVWVAALCVLFILSRSSAARAADFTSQFGLRDPSDSLFSADSHYQYVNVYEREVEDQPDTPYRERLLVLRLDYLVHGYIDPDNPEYFEYDYEKIYRDVAQRFTRDRATLATFFMGGGSYTFPRWVLRKWPGSTVDVAEIDPLVLEANHRALGLPRDTPVRTFLMDARNAIDDLPAERRYDLIFGDAFNDLSVPWHLLTLEFTQKVKSHLAPNGAYIVNLIDSYKSGLLLGSYYWTLKGVFKNVYVFCTETDGVRDTRDTFVIAASDEAIDVSDWQPNHTSELSGSVLTESNLADLYSRSRGRILTDDDAPVENLLAPVVRERK
jgi:spermidine synthase